MKRKKEEERKKVHIGISYEMSDDGIENIEVEGDMTDLRVLLAFGGKEWYDTVITAALHRYLSADNREEFMKTFFSCAADADRMLTGPLTLMIQQPDKKTLN